MSEIRQAIRDELLGRRNTLWGRAWDTSDPESLEGAVEQILSVIRGVQRRLQ